MEQPTDTPITDTKKSKGTTPAAEVTATSVADLASKPVKRRPGKRLPIDLRTFRAAYNNSSMATCTDVAEALQAQFPNHIVSATWVRNFAFRYADVEGSDILVPVERFSAENLVRLANLADARAAA